MTIPEITDELCELLSDDERLRTCQASRDRVQVLEDAMDRIMNPIWHINVPHPGTGEA